MKLEVNINKRYFIILLVSILLLGSIIAVVAYTPGTTGNPSLFGHSANEIEITLPNNVVSTLQSAVTNKLIGDGIGLSNGTSIILTDWPNVISCASVMYYLEQTISNDIRYRTLSGSYVSFNSNKSYRTSIGIPTSCQNRPITDSVWSKF